MLEVSNGWAKIPLEKLAEYAQHVLEIRAGSPLRPSVIDEADVRADRQGFFAGLRKAFGGQIRSQLIISSRPFANLLAAKQV